MKLNYEATTLSNGVRVLSCAMPQVGSAAVGIWVGVGGRYESSAQSGASHFIEHLLFKGTQTRSARDISQAIEGRGGYFNAFTQEESTCYYARIGGRYLWPVLDILTDMYLHPRFSARDIDKERGVIVEEIMMYRDQPQQVVQDMLGEALWSRHALGRPLIGTPENIVRMSRDEIMSFKKNNYVSANTYVVFAGNIEHAACVRETQARMGSLPRAKAPRCPAVTTRTAQAPVRATTKDIEQSHLAMGFRLFGRNDPRRSVLKMLSVVLGENMSSRLFQVVRERYGLAYSLHSSMHLFRETGALMISAGLERKRTAKAVDLIVTELKRLKDKPVGARELQRAKDYAIGQLEIGLESTINQMMWTGETVLSHKRFIQPAEIVERMKAVTARDIQELAGEILSESRVSLTVVSPDPAPEQEAMLAKAASALA
jgi:predicted Zn-dependent peptidase